MIEDDAGGPRGVRPSKMTGRPPTEPIPSRQISSRDLMGGAKELVIVHEGRRYYLRVTQNGKLILTA